ncbi:extensin [Helianthus annuus]|uniref:extensin n=1 Tax=Helianthus annuus TaxID=4232 RepID=UPI000B8F6195|nr:extensin [Helianthus annuus]
MDISSDSDTDLDVHSGASVTSSALQAIGVERYPDFGDDVLSAEPVIPASVQSPTPPHTPVHTPTYEPTQAPVPDGSTGHIQLMHFVPTRLPTRHTGEAGPSGHAHIPPGETDPYYIPHVPVEHLATQYSPPHVMPTADPRLHELQQLTDARPPPPPVHSPPHATPFLVDTYSYYVFGML